MVALLLLLSLVFSTIDGINCMRCFEGSDCELGTSCDECLGVACTRVTSYDVHDNNGLALTCVPFDTRNLLEPILIEEGCYTKGKKEVCTCYGHDYCNSTPRPHFYGYLLMLTFIFTVFFLNE